MNVLDEAITQKISHLISYSNSCSYNTNLTILMTSTRTSIARCDLIAVYFLCVHNRRNVLFLLSAYSHLNLGKYISMSCLPATRQQQQHHQIKFCIQVIIAHIRLSHSGFCLSLSGSSSKLP